MAQLVLAVAVDTARLRAWATSPTAGRSSPMVAPMSQRPAMLATAPPKPR